LVYLAVALFFAQAFAVAPVRLAPKDGLQGRYIVVFHSNTSISEHSQYLSYFAQKHAVNYLHKYTSALKGFAAELTEKQLAQVSKHSGVAYIEQDAIARTVQTCASQPLRNEVWGLDRIDQRSLPLNQVYIFPSSQGEGVDVYIFDTGVYLEHNDFAGRAIFGYKAEAGWVDTDRNGHGTHVASTSAGSYFGVAKKARIIAVKVLSDGGSGSYAGIIAGVDWAIQNKQSTGRPSVGNMSLQGGYNQALNDAVDQASLAGIFLVVAAGNSGAGADSCNYSPSGSNFVINVGASTITDARSSFSSVGTCVSVFAPGSNIPAAWIGNPNAENIISGTSMASPHVAGAVALELGENPDLDFDGVKGAILAKTTPNIINIGCTTALCLSTPNFFLYTAPCGTSA
jgi:subtilisin family serine protease